jgi:hypothetical protein
MVVEAWRSPYFEWSALPVEDAPETIGFAPADADTLGAVARWGRAVGGLSQWEEPWATYPPTLSQQRTRKAPWGTERSR